MRARRRLTILAMVAVAAGLGYAGFAVYRSSQPDFCYACRRPVHAHTRTVALDCGRPRVFCCPACALSEHQQEGKPIRVTELTDFFTGEKLSPAEAFVVKGSGVNMCAPTHGPMNADKRPAGVEYDRCSPSLLAFGKQSDATEFAREHGGDVLAFRDIVSEFAR